MRKSAGHALQPPQCCGSELVSTQPAPGQVTVGGRQVQVPLSQLSLGEHLWPQPPQLNISVSGNAQ